MEGKPLRKASAGKVFFDFTPDLSKTFNREYTEYNIRGKIDNVARTTTPKFIGEPVGEVKGREGRYIIIDTSVTLDPGDGICFFSDKGELYGTFINYVSGQKIKVHNDQGIKTGTYIFRNFDKNFYNKLKASKTKRKIGISLKVSRDNDSIVLTAEDEDGVRISVSKALTGAQVKDKEKFIGVLEKNLSKFGGTEFYLLSLSIDSKDYYFMEIKEINALRRETTEKLRQKREELYIRKDLYRQEKCAIYPEKELDYRGNVLNKLAYNFYLRHGVNKILPAAESGLDLAGMTLMKSRYCIRREVGLCPAKSGTEKAGPLYLTDRKGNLLKLVFNCNECLMEVKLPETSEKKSGGITQFFRKRLFPASIPQNKEKKY